MLSNQASALEQRPWINIMPVQLVVIAIQTQGDARELSEIQNRDRSEPGVSAAHCLLHPVQVELAAGAIGYYQLGPASLGGGQDNVAHLCRHLSRLDRQICPTALALVGIIHCLCPQTVNKEFLALPRAEERILPHFSM